MIRLPLQIMVTVLALLASVGTAMAELPHSTAEVEQVTRPLGVVVDIAVELGIAALVVGMALCLYRLLRGPHLADRVLASDALALHVVGLVITLAIYLQTTDFLDVALVVAILGFASTLAFSQYIAGRHTSEAERSKP